MSYAQNTTVPVEKSRNEIERTISRYGADQFVYGWAEGGNALVGFRYRNRQIKFVLALPAKADFQLTEVKREPRSAAAIEKAWEQACRQRWRALALVVKAKLEAVESGIVSFEDEFLAQTVLPSGETASEWMQPQVERAIETGVMPAMLPALEAGS